MPELLLPTQSVPVTVAKHPVSTGPQTPPPAFDPGRCCAYNQTRERFLAANAEAADFSATLLEARLTALTPDSGAALWIVPFRGISPASVRVPIDLVYVSHSNVVLATVESYPLAPLPPSGSPAAGVLALPASTIAAAQTQSGDRLILCAPHEVERRLQLLHAAKAPQPAPEAPDLPLPAEHLDPAPPQRAKAPKKWLQRLFSKKPSDPRKVGREAFPGLVAYFFTGGVPAPHRIRDVSGTGLYVFTAERWYLGTIIRVTLTDRHQPTHERSITVDARVVRWGNDGVGLQFLLYDSKDSAHGKLTPTDAITGCVGSFDIEEFLDLLRSDPA